MAVAEQRLIPFSIVGLAQVRMNSGSHSELRFTRQDVGLHLADASIFISCAMALAVFDVCKYVDEAGRTIEPVHEYTTGTIR